MANFTVSKAFPAGVGLIERRGGTVLAWGLVIVLITWLPRVLAWALTGDVSELMGGSAQMHAPAAGGSAKSLPELMAQMRQMQAATEGHSSLLARWWLVLVLWSLLGYAVLYNAVYRTVLQPGSSSFAGLRLGAAEFWQFLVLCCQCVLAIIVIALGLAAVAVWTLMAKAVPTPWGGWVAYLGMVGLGVLLVWIALRLSMAGPMTFAEGRFRLFESWAFTKGRSWKLFWTMLLPSALLIGLYLFTFAGMILFVIAPLGLAGQTWTALGGGSLSGAGGQGAAGVALVVYLAFVILVSGVVQAISTAPWAAAYGEMAGSGDSH
jgi:hypothetical protein